HQVADVTPDTLTRLLDRKPHALQAETLRLHAVLASAPVPDRNVARHTHRVAVARIVHQLAPRRVLHLATVGELEVEAEGVVAACLLHPDLVPALVDVESAKLRTEVHSVGDRAFLVDLDLLDAEVGFDHE